MIGNLLDSNGDPIKKGGLYLQPSHEFVIYGMVLIEGVSNERVTLKVYRSDGSDFSLQGNEARKYAEGLSPLEVESFMRHVRDVAGRVIFLETAIGKKD